MNDVDADGLPGKLSSFIDIIKIFLKSRFRVSRIPITCMPCNGSPLYGTRIVCSILRVREVNIGMSVSMPQSSSEFDSRRSVSAIMPAYSRCSLILSV